MKTIYYFLTACCICITLGFSSHKTSKKLILDTAGQNVSLELLTQSAGVIRDRLQTYKLESSVSIIPEKSQIEVQVPEDVNLSEIRDLLTLKGDLGFYETLTPKDIVPLSKLGPDSSSSDGRLLCSTFMNKHITDSVYDILRSKNLSDYKLLWDLKFSKSLTCLYAVKNEPALTRADIENIATSLVDNSQAIAIKIKFRQASAKTWADLTGRNLNKPVAIVIDNRVLYTPVVKTTMENGLCEITGSFTGKEVNFFLALVNNDPLTVDLNMK